MVVRLEGKGKDARGRGLKSTCGKVKDNDNNVNN